MGIGLILRFCTRVSVSKSSSKELFETLTLVQNRKIRPIPIVLVGEAYWRRAIDFDFLFTEGTIAARDRRLYCYAEDARGIWDSIRRWYRRAGGPSGRLSA